MDRSLVPSLGTRHRARSPEPRQPSDRRIFLTSAEAAAGLVLVALAWIHWRIGGQWGTEAFTDLLEVAVPALAAGLCFRASRGLAGRDRRAWRLLGLAAVAWAVGQLVWSYLELLTHSHAFPTPADLFYGASFPLAVVALLSFEAAPSAAGARIRALVEGLMAWVSVFFVGWSIALGPTYRSASGSFVPKLVSTASAGIDVVLVALALMVASRARNFRPFAFIAAGIVFLAAADTGSALTVLRGGQSGPGFIDIGWILGFLLVALGAVTPGRASGISSEPGEAREGTVALVLRRTRLQSLLIYTAWPFVLAIAIWETVHGQQLEPVLKWSAIAMAVLGLTRQILATRESQALARDLERKVRERTAELAEREERFRSLIQNSSDVVMLLDAGLTIRYVTDSAERILGQKPGHLVGRPLAGLLEAGSRDEVMAKLTDVAGKDGATAMVQFRMRRAGSGAEPGGWAELESMVANLLQAPAVGALVLTARDIGERVELESQLRTLAFHDPLTGLPNRTLFRDTVH
ncbi:MAG TPA: PAS domain S-box protein, partial [Actinomycetota bacterium]|nr:PAS domain S-box protein [Actinomycetota bacterium]